MQCRYALMYCLLLVAALPSFRTELARWLGLMMLHDKPSRLLQTLDCRQTWSM